MIDPLREIADSLRTHKTRTALAVLTVAWGIFMLVLLLGAGRGIQNGVELQFRDDAVNSIKIYRGKTTVDYNGLPRGRSIQYNNDDYNQVRANVDHVDKLTGRYYVGQNLVVYNGIQAGFESLFGAAFHDFAGSVVVHGMGGWLALGAVVMLGARKGRYNKKGQPMSAHPPSSIPFLALGAWTLSVGWFGFNVVSAQAVEGISGLVAINSLMAMVGGILAAVVFGKNDPGFVHNGPLAGLVAVCAGSDLMHPLGALLTGIVAGVLFVWAFTAAQNRWKIDDVLGVWPLHGICGAWGGIAAGIFGLEAFGGMGGVSFLAQLAGTAMGVILATAAGFIVYGALKKTVGIRLSEEEEHAGADLSIHRIKANPEI